jgi:hypothetical protein
MYHNPQKATAARRCKCMILNGRDGRVVDGARLESVSLELRPPPTQTPNPDGCEPSIRTPLALIGVAKTIRRKQHVSRAGDVALFLPFRRTKDRQTRASAGTKRRAEIVGF